MNEYISIFLKSAIFLTILNVWLLRFNKPTPYRGGDAKSMKEEFQVYGFSSSTMYIIGAIKILLASAILASIWYTDWGIWASAGLGVFMLGAIVMHFKANDPSIRSLPALSILVGCILIISLETFI